MLSFGFILALSEGNKGKHGKKILLCKHYVDVVEEKRSKLTWSPICQNAVTELAAVRQNAATHYRENSFSCWVLTNGGQVSYCILTNRQPSELLRFSATTSIFYLHLFLGQGRATLFLCIRQPAFLGSLKKIFAFFNNHEFAAKINPNIEILRSNLSKHNGLL